MEYKFGTNSLSKLKDAHKDLNLILKLAIKLTKIDFGISDTYRSIERQNKYFKEGKSKIDGYTKKGKHNYYPSLAADIYPYFDNNAKWDNEHLSYLAGVIDTVAEILYKEGKITHKVRWGGNWDMDGIILLDQTFNDRPHFELIKPK